MADEVLLERLDRDAILTLNRPDRAHTHNPELTKLMQGLALEAANDSDVRVLVVTGAGRHFCGGADLRDASRRAGAARPAIFPGPGLALDWVSKPVIAAINGACMGGGCEIALSCDFRYISNTAKIGLPEIRFGALPAAGGPARAPRLIGLSQAKRLIMVGEPVDAEEAKRIGLVDEVCAPEELMEKVIELASVLASRAPYALRAAKQILNRTLQLDLASALELERSFINRMGSPEEIQQ